MKTINFMSNVMRKSLLTLGLGLLVSWFAVFPGMAADSGLKSLRGHVPAVVSGLQSNGRLPATNELVVGHRPAVEKHGGAHEPAPADL